MFSRASYIKRILGVERPDHWDLLQELSDGYLAKAYKGAVSKPEISPFVKSLI